MIVDAVLSICRVFVGLLSDAMPAVSSAWDSRPTFSGWGTWLGTKIGPLDAVVPVSTVCQLLDVTFSYVLPALVVYGLAHWIYSHIPIIGKG